MVGSVYLIVKYRVSDREIPCIWLLSLGVQCLDTFYALSPYGEVHSFFVPSLSILLDVPFCSPFPLPVSTALRRAATSLLFA